MPARLLHRAALDADLGHRHAIEALGDQRPCFQREVQRYVPVLSRARQVAPQQRLPRREVVGVRHVQLPCVLQVRTHAVEEVASLLESAGAQRRLNPLRQQDTVPEVDVGGHRFLQAFGNDLQAGVRVRQMPGIDGLDHHPVDAGQPRGVPKTR